MFLNLRYRRFRRDTPPPIHAKQRRRAPPSVPNRTSTLKPARNHRKRILFDQAVLETRPDALSVTSFPPRYSRSHNFTSAIRRHRD